MGNLQRSVLAAVLFSTFINELNDGMEVMLTHLVDSLDGWMSILADLDTVRKRMQSDEDEALHSFWNSPL